MFDFFFWRRELLPMPYNRELHCHLIPGVDDGAQSMDFSIKALKALERFGVGKVIFTPHFTNPNFLNTPTKIQPIFDQVKAKVKEKGLEIECENFSFEYRMDSAFESIFNEGILGDQVCDIRPLKGNWLLVENGWREPYEKLESLVANLREKGYKLIIAHPERYGYYFGMNGEHYHRLHDLGLLFQCNILSFSGYYGSIVRDTAMWMLEHNYVSFLASDMHHQQHINLIEHFLRSQRYADIIEDLEQSIGNDRL